MAVGDFNNKYNKDDVFIRNMIVAFLAELDKKLYIYNRLEDNKIERVEIPCLYSITGQERFLKDNFQYDALLMGKAIGDYERVPRCMVNMTGLTINTGEQTNKYTRTKIVREVNGILKTLYLNVDYVPVNLSFDCNIICSNNIEMFKVTECLISKLYKNINFFKIDLGMFQVDGQFLVPESYNNEMTTEFGVGEKKEFKVSFSVDMKSFIPCFEHGLLMCEIDEMLSKLDGTQNGLVEFRANKYGEMEMLIGGVLTNITSSTYYGNLSDRELLSNRHDTLDPRGKDVAVYEDLIDRNTVKNS